LWGAPAQAPAPAQHQPPANYLARYGTEADTVRQWKATFGDQPLVAGLPHTLGELHYVVCQTDACTADDVLLRRLRLGMVNQAEAEQLRPFVVQVLAEYGFAAAESEVTVR
jgi:glycerol-3-phosphate dehydrogenase